MRRFLLFILCLAIAFSASAEQSSTTDQKTSAGVKAFESAKQSPEMKKFIDTFAGRWRTTITLEKNEWFPVAGTAKGRSDMLAGPAGNSALERQRSNGPLGDFAGNGVYWYDEQSKSYKGVWCDSMDPRGCGDIGSANWQGDNFVITNDTDSPQGKMHIRETFSNLTHDSYDMVMEASVGNSPMKKMMSIHYQRISAAERE